ncbi:hypothetical protein FGO68_gene14055 [Halteria grandinella]|uniref:Secreted protein n=1 Tax=Halteria grandinella TaxID=5974 RepID=A0A8J8NA93_HALGN|nr:hypothetical protein FGO68_gene14055 [Halteria grandinella]
MVIRARSKRVVLVSIWVVFIVLVVDTRREEVDPLIDNHRRSLREEGLCCIWLGVDGVDTVGEHNLER